MSLPIIAAGAAALGVLFYAMNSKAAPGLGGKKGKVSPLPTKPIPDFKPEAAVVFKPEPKPTKVTPVATPAIHPELDVLNPVSGAVQVATSPTGAQVFQKPDGGLVEVMAPVEIIGKPTPSEAQVKAGAVDEGKGKRTGVPYFKWVQTSINLVAPPNPKLSVDGQYGAKSKAAVKVYQANKGLNPDGIVGLNTETALSLDSSSLPPWAFA